MCLAGSAPPPLRAPSSPDPILQVSTTTRHGFDSPYLSPTQPAARSQPLDSMTSLPDLVEPPLTFTPQTTPPTPSPTRSPSSSPPSCSTIANSAGRGPPLFKMEPSTSSGSRWTTFAQLSPTRTRDMAVSGPDTSGAVVMWSDGTSCSWVRCRSDGGHEVDEDDG
jgi:hypothetical protein